MTNSDKQLLTVTNTLGMIIRYDKIQQMMGLIKYFLYNLGVAVSSSILLSKGWVVINDYNHFG